MHGGAGGMSGCRRSIVCGTGQLQFLPPPLNNLSKRRKARKCSPAPVKRHKEPVLQMGKESPQPASSYHRTSEETNQDCLRVQERAGRLPKGSQCSPLISSQSQQLQSRQGKVAVFPSRAWGQVQGPVALTSPALPLGPDPRS